MKDSPLIVRRDHVFCATCCCVEPISPGDGTPATTFILALEAAMKRHPAKHHSNPFKPQLSPPEPCP